MFEPRRLSPLIVEEKEIYSESLLNDSTSHPLFKKDSDSPTHQLSIPDYFYSRFWGSAGAQTGSLGVKSESSTQQRKLISPTRIHDLALSVTTHSW